MLFLALFGNLPLASATTSYSISPAAFPDLCVVPASSSSGSKVTLAACTSTSIVFDVSGSAVRNTDSDLCLDLPNGVDSSGSLLQFWACNSDANQQWSAPQGGDGIIQWAGGNVCMDLTNGDGQAGTDMQVWSCSGSNANQQWVLTAVEEQNGGVVTTSKSGTSASPNSEATVNLWTSSGSSGVLQTSGQNVVDPSGNIVNLKGVNLGGWLVPEDWMDGITDNSGNGARFCQVTLESRFGEDQTNELLNAWYDSFLSSDDFDKIAAMGFNVIRLPFGYRNLQKADGSWRSDAFDRMDWAIAQAKQRGIYTIPVFHVWDTQQSSYSLISENSDAGQMSRNAASAIWKKVAKHYIGESAIAAYDAINEPTGSWGDKLHQDLYNAIRSVDVNRIIILESISTAPSTYGWTNVMYSMHEYLLMGDGSSVDYSQWNGAQSDIDLWKGYNMPVYIGEFMGHADGALSFILDKLNGNGVWWSMWSWKTVDMGDWGIYNFEQGWVDVQNDDFNSIKSTWSNLGSASFNWDIYNTYQSAASGATGQAKRSDVVSPRAGLPTRRVAHTHRRSRRWAGHGVHETK